MHIKKTLALFLVILYGYSQSVFSHLIVMNQHHDVVVKEVNHIHQDGENHEHSVKTNTCNDQECENNCNNIEKSKLVLYSNQKDFSDILDTGICDTNCNIIVFSNKITYPSDTILNVGTPISIETLMPRIGPVVRII